MIQNANESTTVVGHYCTQILMKQRVNWTQHNPIHNHIKNSKLWVQLCQRWMGWRTCRHRCKQTGHMTSQLYVYSDASMKAHQISCASQVFLIIHNNNMNSPTAILVLPSSLFFFLDFKSTSLTWLAFSKSRTPRFSLSIWWSLIVLACSASCNLSQHAQTQKKKCKASIEESSHLLHTVIFFSLPKSAQSRQANERLWHERITWKNQTTGNTRSKGGH